MSFTHGLHILFASLCFFANAGVSLHGITLDMLTHPITLGIATGLFW